MKTKQTASLASNLLRTARTMLAQKAEELDGNDEAQKTIEQLDAAREYIKKASAILDNIANYN